MMIGEAGGVEGMGMASQATTTSLEAQTALFW
jgi:hypothetical protein